MEKAEYKAHKSQLVTEALDSGQAPGLARAAAKAGAKAAVTVTSWEAVWIAFRDGWRENWARGKHRGETLRMGTAERHVEEEAQMWPNQAAFCEVHLARTAADFNNLWEAGMCAEEVDYEECPAGHLIPVFCKKNPCPEHLRIAHSEIVREAKEREAKELEAQADDSAEQGNSHQHQNSKENPDMIDTRTGGEVLTKEQYKTEIEAVIREATAELEDAQGDIKRAQEDVARVETMAASLVSAQIDTETVAATRKLVDTNPDRMRLARDRIAAAEGRKAAAEECLNKLNASAQNNFYAA
ncbi:hypothetical protein [Lentzea guizhouensis]|uniref:hypothetical protein n=1 Tax=Lentzea guizhouensis TaxID=1586287 RepID=UPI001472EC04|nr:hypothetical protein [Lentzea guizhouensis]